MTALCHFSGALLPSKCRSIRSHSGITGSIVSMTGTTVLYNKDTALTAWKRTLHITRSSPSLYALSMNPAPLSKLHIPAHSYTPPTLPTALLSPQPALLDGPPAFSVPNSLRLTSRPPSCSSDSNIGLGASITHQFVRSHRPIACALDWKSTTDLRYA